jgi:AMP deaminase
MKDLSASKYQLVEWRISIYGRKASEWSSLARWFYVHRLAHPNVRWLIQIPRLYDVYRKSGEIQNFGQMLANIFLPLFAVSIDPESNPPLHYLLQTVVGIDSVDDESRAEYDQLSSNNPAPEFWNMPNSPPYGYWMYYMYSNICVLNKLRASRGLSTFQFRPHCGEAGDVDHLISTYILAHQINHGILLRKSPGLQFLYYLSQIGIAMSPLSNNKLFLNFNKNPFIKYFQQGLNVSLSTDDPLMLHMTKDPLLEEYSVAAQVWKLSQCDQCEIARNSVLQSGWERKYKLHFLGKDYSDIRETNVPLIRLLYRQETLADEIYEINKNANSNPK